MIYITGLLGDSLDYFTINGVLDLVRSDAERHLLNDFFFINSEWYFYETSFECLSRGNSSRVILTIGTPRLIGF